MRVAALVLIGLVGGVLGAYVHYSVRAHQRNWVRP